MKGFDAKLERLEVEVTYYKELYQHFKSKYEAATLVVVDDPYLPIEEKQKETLEMYIKQPLFNKEQTMETEQLIGLTKDASLYQFRNYPNFKIIEILVPENKDLRKERACTVWYRDQMNELEYIMVFPNGSCNIVRDPWDVILKPVPKTRPMTHEEIMELRAKGAVFHHKDCPSSLLATFVTITAYYEDNKRYFFENNIHLSYTLFVQNYVYSLDYTKTWHSLTVEEK